MYKKLNNLSFIIGLFFTIVAIILLFTSGKLNMYTGIIFLIFGLCMMFINQGSNSNKPG